MTQEEKKMALQILDTYGRSWFSEEDDLDDPMTGFVSRPDALKAMEEYRKQGLPTEEEIEQLKITNNRGNEY